MERESHAFTFLFGSYRLLLAVCLLASVIITLKSILVTI